MAMLGTLTVNMDHQNVRETSLRSEKLLDTIVCVDNLRNTVVCLSKEEKQK